MMKAENRAAAKAYQQEKERRWREEARTAAVTADLKELRRLRNYLIFNAKMRIPYYQGGRRLRREIYRRPHGTARLAP
jgi:hypothetical protein